jgi:hypothetical protein
LTTAFELACGAGSIRGPGSRRPAGTFVVVDTVPWADGSGRPYTVVQTVIGGQVCWPREAGRALQPDRA